MYYVYRFLDKSKNIIYVGKSKQDLEQRFRGHLHLPDACYDLVYKIEYIECATESDMSIKEIYYINKYRNDHIFFNVLDTTDVPISVEFDDKWKQYKGPLGAHFHHSINYIKGYAKEKAVRYNKDGTIDQRKPNAQKGVETYVEGLTADEVNLIVDHLINELNCAENNNQEQIRFRNLLMFVLGVNLPLKSNDFLCLKYQDLFDEKDCPKALELKLSRFHKDKIIKIPLKESVKKLLLAYTKRYGLTYTQNASDNLFQSRKHQILTHRSWWNILSDATEAVKIDKNIGVESIRKTYGLNIYNLSFDKLNALLFLGELWGHARESQVIKYLNLTDAEINFEYYLGETFSLGNVDLSKIDCLTPARNALSWPILKIPHRTDSSAYPNSANGIHATTLHRDISKTVDQKTSGERIQQPQRETKKVKTGEVVDTGQKKKNRVWPKEIKLEIVEKHLTQNVPLKALAEEYGIDKTNICHWISDYRNYGESAFEDKRRKSK